MLIDTHCHLEMPHFDNDRSQVISGAMAAGVTRMLTVGTSLAGSKTVLEIAKANRTVFCSVGIHPHDSVEADESAMAVLKGLAAHEKVLAIGEIGLDHFKNYASEDVQIRAFELQLGLADELSLPIIIHDRDAHDSILSILKGRRKTEYTGVFHCFAGDAEFAKQVLDLGFYISFTGNITFKKEVKSHEVLKMAPRDRVMLETDCPFLTPTPFRGKRNEPAYVPYIARKLAEIWGLPEQEVAEVTTENAYRLFGFETASVQPKIAYTYKGALYLNLTNRCSNRCAFCAKWPDFMLGSEYLRLKSEPSVDEIIKKAGDVSKYPEVVFCGYGEPTERLDVVLQVAARLRELGVKRIRLNTNGQSDLINNKPTAGLLAQNIDAVSVSLNAQDQGTYQTLCRSRFGDKAYDAVKKLIVDARRAHMEVTASVVNLPEVNVLQCREIAENELKVQFRLRG